MATQEIILDNQMYFKGVFSLQDLMTGLRNFLENKGYQVDEVYHNQSEKGDAKKHEIRWEVYKMPDRYAQIKWICIFILDDLRKIKIIDENKVEIMRDDGKLMFRVMAYAVTDYVGRWDANPVTRFMRAFYEKYIYGKYSHPGLSRGAYNKLVGMCETDALQTLAEAKNILKITN